MKVYFDIFRWAGVMSLLVLAPAAAMAYIDPGNGAYMVQALFTVAAAALFYLRHPVTSAKAFWRWVTQRRGRFSDDSLESDSGGQVSPPLEEAVTHSSPAAD